MGKGALKFIKQKANEKRNNEGKPQLPKRPKTQHKAPARPRAQTRGMCAANASLVHPYSEQMMMRTRKSPRSPPLMTGKW